MHICIVVSDLSRIRDMPVLTCRFPGARLPGMRMRELIQRNTEAFEASVKASEASRDASVRVAEAADRQARACETQSEVLRDQMAEIKHLGEQVRRSTDALVDSFAMLAADLRRGRGASDG